MASGLLALLDDVTALVKVAAAAVDDVAAQAAKAGGKAAGIVIDDAAVTPRYVVGLGADRELPIIRRIAWGSVKNKTLYLLPGALLLSTFAPWSITPLLIAGGMFLCMEGFGKVAELVRPPRAGQPTQAAAPIEPTDPHALEQARVSDAIRTDFILSAEIMAITLATVGDTSLGTKAAVLCLVGLGVTFAVYGAVMLIVKADDFGLALARGREPWATPGRLLVRAMPGVLTTLSVVGMLAMLWVGGGIILHALAEYGLKAPEYGIKQLGVAIGALSPIGGDLLGWLVAATLSGVVGLAIGGLTQALVHRVVQPAIQRVKAV
ncbi:MAG: DUF808 family protein [Rhodocyclaceae bacterium]|nr:DUF808 family protein [Rhodocyclaceae bacterium]